MVTNISGELAAYHILESKLTSGNGICGWKDGYPSVLLWNLLWTLFQTSTIHSSYLHPTSTVTFFPTTHQSPRTLPWCLLQPRFYVHFFSSHAYCTFHPSYPSYFNGPNSTSYQEKWFRLVFGRYLATGYPNWAFRLFLSDFLGKLWDSTFK